MDAFLLGHGVEAPFFDFRVVYEFEIKEALGDIIRSKVRVDFFFQSLFTNQCSCVA